MISAVTQFILQSDALCEHHHPFELQNDAGNNIFVFRSAHRQAATHHSTRPVQSDTRGGQCGTVEVPGIRRSHTLHQLAEGWGQPAGEGPPHVPAGAG